MGIDDEENKQHPDIDLPSPAPEPPPHQKGDKIDPKIEWEGVEDIDDGLDFSALKDLDMLEVLEDAEQAARKQKTAAIEMQGMIALKAIINGADPIEVAKRCGFDISDPDHMHEKIPPGISPKMWRQMGNGPTGNRSRFFGWLAHNFTSVVEKQLEEKEGS